MCLQFEILHRDRETRARVGRLGTHRGSVDTPAFLPVGSQGAIRGLTPEQVRSTGTQMILSNTYHLHLRPGEDVVKQAGGLQRFMGWDGPILTDSGGFQVFSLAEWNRVDEEGVTFKSFIDGSLVRWTPEIAIAIQNDLGADIVMVLDLCPRYGTSRDAMERAVEQTTRWAYRCRQAHSSRHQALFGIVQGGVHLDLRSESLESLTEMDFSGYAIGGVSVGEPREEIHRIVSAVAPLLPDGKPRYVMGLGAPEDLLAGIAAGVDLFDCVLATRNARNASLFTRRGLVRIRNHAHKRDLEPLDKDCSCYTCRNFSRAYLHHLHTRKESLAGTLGSIHNIQYLQDLMFAARTAITGGAFHLFWRDFPESFLETSRKEPR